MLKRRRRIVRLESRNWTRLKKMGCSMITRAERRELKIKLEVLIFKEEILWRQKEKANWAKLGDNNTRFFHRLVNGRRNCYFINKMETRDGVIIENNSKIEEEIISYFKDLYSHEEISRPVPPELRLDPIPNHLSSWLKRPFTEEDIQNSVFQCCPEKSPDLMVLLWLFFIAVGNRQIFDAVLVAKEVVEKCSKKKKEGLVIKIDFENGIKASMHEINLLFLEAFCLGVMDLFWIGLRI
ncbi:hypothetical protein EZV62_014872 [Acer yangbiense]|uniref:Reverse transcriptase zinc-binding domain-containing protein n=1 Tax=Acer yangbiense TaxID=1000413 RepID=A0A5C7HU86_9ROSI|nr:hypothetical protein EZV62_014872 [Acer yangbiense]